MTRLAIHQTASGKVTILTRGRGDGLDSPRAEIVSVDGDVLNLRVPGHREASGYDRLSVKGNTTHDYVPAATHRLKIESTDTDRYGTTYQLSTNLEGSDES